MSIAIIKKKVYRIFIYQYIHNIYMILIWNLVNWFSQSTDKLSLVLREFFYPKGNLSSLFLLCNFGFLLPFQPRECTCLLSVISFLMLRSFSTKFGNEYHFWKIHKISTSMFNKQTDGNNWNSLGQIWINKLHNRRPNLLQHH